MVHSVISEPCFEFGGEFATGSFALSADLAYFRQTGRDRGVLASPSEEGQADRHPGGYIVAKARIAVLIRSVHPKIGFSIGLGKSNIGCGLADARLGGRKHRVRINRFPKSLPIDRKVRNGTNDGRIRITRPAGEVCARFPYRGNQLIASVVKLGKRLPAS